MEVVRVADEVSQRVRVWSSHSNGFSCLSHMKCQSDPLLYSASHVDLFTSYASCVALNSSPLSVVDVSKSARTCPLMSHRRHLEHSIFCSLHEGNTSPDDSIRTPVWNRGGFTLYSHPISRTRLVHRLNRTNRPDRPRWSAFN